MSIEIAGTDGPETVEIDHQPAVISGVVSFLAGLLAVLTSAVFSGLAIPFGVTGLLFLGVGLFVKGSRQWVSLGVTSLFVGVLIVGVLGFATPIMLAISAVGLMVSWDVGQHAVTIGEQFGRTAPTQRGELIHAAASAIVGTLAAGIAYGIYWFGTGGQPALAVILFVTGAVAATWALRD